jgi:hypothetical protein
LKIEIEENWEERCNEEGKEEKRRELAIRDDVMFGGWPLAWLLTIEKLFRDPQYRRTIGSTVLRTIAPANNSRNQCSTKQSQTPPNNPELKHWVFIASFFE